jgi:hypothetical protein
MESGPHKDTQKDISNAMRFDYAYFMEDRQILEMMIQRKTGEVSLSCLRLLLLPANSAFGKFTLYIGS